MKNNLTSAYAFIAGLITLHLAAYILPESLTWGFHSLVFLGPVFLIPYIGLIITLFLLDGNNLLEPAIERASSVMEKKPALFLSAAVSLFLGAGFVFRLGVPLLGDSWFLVKNFSQVLSGTEPLYPRNEPLSGLYYSSVSDLLGISSYGDFLTSFFVADMIVGALFVVVLYFVVRELFPEREGRFAAYFLALCLPSTYLFFGYVETYAPVCLAVSLYMLTGLLCLRGKVPYTVVIMMFLLQAFTHYLTLLLFPSLLYIAYRRFKAGKIVEVVIGFSLACIMIIGGLLITGYGLNELYSQVPHHHYLPLTPPTGELERYSFPYTLFSPFHFADIINLLILLAPSTVFFCAAAYAGGRIRKEKTAMPPGARYLCWGIAPVILFAGIAKFDLGIARDWDVTAPFAFLFVLGAAAYFLRVVPGQRGIRITGLIAGITLIHSLLWFSLNSSDRAALHRFYHLLDRRTVSQEGIYGGHLSLAMLHHQTGLGTLTPVELWKGYVRSYPLDIRGYVNVLRNLDPSRDESTSALIRRWMETAAGDGEIMRAVFTACFSEGTRLMEERKGEKAKALFESALEIDPRSAAVYNNMGILRAQAGDITGAVEMFEKTISLDTNYNEAYFNLGRAYTEVGKRDRARWAFGESAKRGNREAREYLERRGSAPKQ